MAKKYFSSQGESLCSKAQTSGWYSRKKLPSVISWRVFHPFIWSSWSQLLLERHLVLLSVAAPILKSKHILHYTGRQKSAVACSDKWIMWCVSSFTLWCWVRCYQSANWVGQGFYEHQSNPLWQQVPCLVETACAELHLPLAICWQSSVCMCSDPNLSCSVLSVWTSLKSQAD